ncbi:hypothetical protein RhiirA4_390985 [Rhizophagus irregularis]|uniref:Uncharacterized protein n=1 Tax=Rhizophagus irregularis TaxID=588596 RepID=A0A2I1FTV0_9GLOM|nr:hypothetical protein RhiirA4_390985 [Rhizophagus irregularis]
MKQELRYVDVLYALWRVLIMSIQNQWISISIVGFDGKSVIGNDKNFIPYQ